MADFAVTFPWVLVDRLTGVPVANATGGVLLDESRNPVETYSTAGVLTALRTGATGMLEPFSTTISFGVAKFGSYETLIISDRGMRSLDEATAAKAAALAAQTAAELAVTKAAAVSNIYLGPDGSVYYSDEVVANGGGILAQQGDRIFAVFP